MIWFIVHLPPIMLSIPFVGHPLIAVDCRIMHCALLIHEIHPTQLAALTCQAFGIELPMSQMFLDSLKSARQVPRLLGAY